MRRSFDLLLRDFERALTRPADAKRGDRLRDAAENLRFFRSQLVADLAKTLQLIEIARAVRATTGVGRAAAEESLMENLAGIARQCSFVLEDSGVKR